MTASSGAPAPTVKLHQGTYVGTIIPESVWYPKAVEAFRGIPYAETTAGKNRFRPPVALGPSNQTFQAQTLGSAAPGSNASASDKAAIEGEDCLNLNVYKPSGLSHLSPSSSSSRVQRRLPVVVYVHGGAFNVGVGTERNMASFVSWAKEPLIAVNFNYRVGALGFLPSSLAAREGLLNLGLKDQQLLFSWVQENIAAFGGDPDNVTLMGLSAGAHSIGHHLMYYSYSSNPPPFAKAILESGATTARAVFYPTHPRHETQFREFLAAAGIDHLPEDRIFAALRRLPVDVITQASRSVWNRYQESVCWPFQPVIDGPNPHRPDVSSSSSHGTTGIANGSAPANNATEAVIPDLPIASWRKGRHLRIPVLTGFNTNEGTIFVPRDANTDDDFRRFFLGLIPTLDAADVEGIETLYPDTKSAATYGIQQLPSDVGWQWARLDAAYSHYAYICPVLQTAHFLSAYSSGNSGGSKINNSSSVYVYQYAAASSMWGTANHGDEAIFVAHDMAALAGRSSAESVAGGGGAFPGPQGKGDGGPPPGIRAIADAIHGAWTNFIVSKDGNPNPRVASSSGSSSSESWWPPFISPAVSGGKGHVMVFGAGNNERFDAGNRARGNGAGRAGVTANVRSLTAAEVERCQFWWERVELSQGFGKRSQGKRDNTQIKGKL
ncbi:hypothetical protein VTK73DRAFT_10026 [Phialemonium thermophilum]|uniref:Carboxylic ester hydrolase n=1 Tax=Phialemonium thermophilum TaxID=223376 RepID=A0ABR3Y586_9PEZI